MNLSFLPVCRAKYFDIPIFFVYLMSISLLSLYVFIVSTFTRWCIWRTDLSSPTTTLSTMMSKGFHAERENKSCASSKPVTPAYRELVEKHAIYDQAKSNTERAFLAKSYWCKGRYALMRLPNHDCTTLVQPDAMHTITNVITTLVGLLSGNANISQVLLEEEEFGQREWYRDVQTVKGTDINICRIFNVI